MKEFIPTAVVPIVGSLQFLRLRRGGRIHRSATRLFVMGLVCFALTELGRGLYRPIVYSRGWNDFGVANTLGSSLGTWAVIFLVLAVAGRGSRRDLLIIAAVTLALLGYELLDVLIGQPLDGPDLTIGLMFGLLAVPAHAALIAWTPSKTHERLGSNKSRQP